MQQLFLTIAGGIVAGIVVGIILLYIQYHTNWFARPFTSSSKKQARIKSSPKQLPSKKPDLTKDRRNQYTSISGFLKKEWWVGVSGLVGTILVILGIIQVILPGGFGNRIVSPPPSDIKENSQQPPQQSEEPSIEYREHPTPSEIKDEIGGLPPYQQDKAGDNYVGLKVQWHLRLFLTFTSDSDPNVIKIALVEDSSLSPTVWCNIDIREHPEIKTTDQYSGVFVKGEISRAKQFEIELINCTVKID